MSSTTVRSRSTLFGTAVGAFVWNGLVGLSAWGIWHRFSEEGRKSFVDAIVEEPQQIALLLIWFIFPIVGLLLLAKLVRSVADAFRFGSSTLALNSQPAPIGGLVDGVIRSRGLHLAENDEILLTLECRAMQARRSTDGITYSQHLEWTNDRVIPQHEISMLDGGAMIPVEMPIPSSCRHSSGEKIEIKGGGSDTYSWWLRATVEPHHGWNAEFEVPVSGRVESPVTQPRETGDVLKMPNDPRELAGMSFSEMASLGEKLQQKGRKEKSARMGAPSRPRSSRIAVHPADDGGVAFEYPATTSVYVTALVWLLTLPLYLIAYLLYLQLHLGAALGWLLGALVVNGCAAWIVLRGWPRRLVIAADAITMFYGLPFIGKRMRIATSEAGEVKADPDHFAITRKGQTSLLKRSFFVAPTLSSGAEARWLGAEIEQALSRYRTSDHPS